MSKTLSCNLDKQSESAGISRALGIPLRFGFAAGYVKGCRVGRQDHVAVCSSASSQFPRYVQLGSGGLGQQVQSGIQRSSVLALRRAATFREMWGGSVVSFSKRTLGSTLCQAWVRTWGHEGKGEMEMTTKGDSRCSGV